MKKIYPYILPALALLIVFILTIRWYAERTADKGQVGQFGEGVEVESIDPEDLDDFLSGVNEMETITMEGSDDLSTGEIRYEIRDDKIYFSVNALLESPESGHYQVWLRSLDGTDQLKAFELSYGKAGYFGSAAVVTEILPFEVLVAHQDNGDDIGEVLFSAVVEHEVEEDES